MNSKTHHILLISIIIATILGLILGILISDPSSIFHSWGDLFLTDFVEFLGKIFLNALKGLVIPLIFFSLISGIASFGDVRKMGKPGLITVIYYTFTTSIAVVIGLLAVNIFQPGVGVNYQVSDGFIPPKEYSFYDTLLNMVSPNILKDAVEMNILPVIIFTLVFGGVLTTLKKGKMVLEISETINEAILKIIQFIIFFAPVGIFGLIAFKFASIGLDSLSLEFQKIGAYILVVIGALFFHGLFILSPILYFIGKKNPLWYFTKVAPALMTAFSTASSSATLPLTMECVENEAKVSPQSTKFVAPLGATINMDGTALYEAIAAMFIAQAYGIDLSIGSQIIIFLTATLAAIGAAGIPQAGLVTMIVVLQAVGLPVEGIGLLLTIDWLLDRFRTTINVWGDAVGCAVVEKLALQK
jgi:Na+/H+-dicarboxylate symporter